MFLLLIAPNKILFTKCDDRELRTTSKQCDKKRVNPFWTPPIIIEEEKFCYHCWFTDSFKNPVSATFVVVMILLCIGMAKMFFVHFCCRYKDGRQIDIVGIVLGTTNIRHTKEYVTILLFYSVKLKVSFIQEVKKCNHSIPFRCLLLRLFTYSSTNDDIMPLEKKENG